MAASFFLSAMRLKPFSSTALVSRAKSSGGVMGFIQDLKKPRVSVIQLHGPLQSGKGRNRLNIDNTQPRIDQAFKPKRLEAVLLNINSPGGSAVQSDLIADYIQFKAKDKNVPVYSFVEDMAASGGYWVACAGEKIFVTKTSITGSIGVIYFQLGLDKLIEKWNIEGRLITAGKNKSFSNPFMPQEEEQKEKIKKILESVHESFKNHVRESRGNRLKADDNALFNGDVWVGQSAVEVGLVDGVSTIPRFVKEEFGDSVKVAHFKAKASPLAGLLPSQVSLRDVLQNVQEEELLSLLKARLS